jgi:uncharacterized protein (TIGR03435 family)
MLCRILSLAAAVLSFTVSAQPPIANPQTHASSSQTAQPAKQFEFEVFSIRPHKPGTQLWNLDYMPDGFRVTWTLDTVIEFAYSPRGLPRSSLKMVRLPDWANTELYDIEGRVAPADMAAWAQAGPDFEDSELLRMALRAALEDRCKLARHITAVEVPYWNIVVGKHGATLTETVPGTIQPVPGKTSVAGKGISISRDDGKRQFVGVSMRDLATVLMRLSRDRPVQDKTGLTGRYDFVLPYLDAQHYPESEVATPLDRMPLASVGLMLEKGKGPGLMIDIESIQRPSEN